jgi:hypothetical protein
MARTCRCRARKKAALTADKSVRIRTCRACSLRAMAGACLSGLITLSALTAPAFSQAGRSEDAQRFDLQWGRYTSVQSRTEVDVPLALFEVSRPLRQGADGHLFQTRDGRVELRVSGSSAPRIVGSFDAYRRMVARDEPTMSYRAGGKSWFVLSGRQGGEIRYTKVIERCGAAHSIFFRYPASQKRRYDPIVSRVSSSLNARCSAQ